MMIITFKTYIQILIRYRIKYNAEELCVEDDEENKKEKSNDKSNMTIGRVDEVKREDVEEMKIEEKAFNFYQKEKYFSNVEAAD